MPEKTSLEIEVGKSYMFGKDKVRVVGRNRLGFDDKKIIVKAQRIIQVKGVVGTNPQTKMPIEGMVDKPEESYVLVADLEEIKDAK